MGAVLDALIAHGGLAGIVLAAAVLMIGRQQKQLNAVQEKRVEDAQGVSGKILDLVEQQHSVTHKLGEALSQNTTSIRELRDEIRSRAVGGV